MPILPVPSVANASPSARAKGSGHDLLTPTLISPRAYQRMIRLAVAALLGALLLGVLPTLAHQYQPLSLTRQVPVPVAPAPVSPTTQTLPPGLGPVLNATLAADRGQGYVARSPLHRVRSGRTTPPSGSRPPSARTASASPRRMARRSRCARQRSPPPMAASPLATAATNQRRFARRIPARRADRMVRQRPARPEQRFTLYAARPPVAEQFRRMSLAVTGDMPTQD